MGGVGCSSSEGCQPGSRLVRCARRCPTSYLMLGLLKLCCRMTGSFMFIKLVMLLCTSLVQLACSSGGARGWRLVPPAPGSARASAAGAQAGAAAPTVKAAMGTVGKSERRVATSRYAGLKSWPHSLQGEAAEARVVMIVLLDTGLHSRVG